MRVELVAGLAVIAVIMLLFPVFKEFGLVPPPDLSGTIASECSECHQ
jgi:hypothetical protein